MKKVKLNTPEIDKLSVEELDNFVNAKLTLKQRLNNYIINVLNKGIDLLNKSKVIKLLVFIYELKKKGQKLENITFTYITWHPKNKIVPVYVTNIFTGDNFYEGDNVVNLHVRSLNLKHIS